MPQYCTQCRFLMDDKQLCPYCHAEGRRLNSMYCPPCGIRIHSSHCPRCGTHGAYPMLSEEKKEVFLTLVRGFYSDLPVREAAMKFLRILHTAGIYNEHRESIEACLSVMEESHELIPLASYSVMPLIIYLAMEYQDNSAEWFNQRTNTTVVA